MHHVVAGALVRAGRVLLAHRSPGRRWYPDVWDLPGGHVEAGETEPQALARELTEELGIQVLELRATPALRLDSDPSAGVDGLRLAVWVVRSWTGEVVNRSPDEHDALHWATAADLPRLRLADDAYLPFLLGLTTAPP